jgi:hypothetical protein
VRCGFDTALRVLVAELCHFRLRRRSDEKQLWPSCTFAILPSLDDVGA